MFVGPRPKAAARNTKTALIALLVLFVLYQVWSYHDRFTFEAVTILGDQVLKTPITTTAKTIPKKIWYKLGPKGLSEEAKQWTETCISQNPGWSYEYLTVSLCAGLHTFQTHTHADNKSRMNRQKTTLKRPSPSLAPTSSKSTPNSPFRSSRPTSSDISSSTPRAACGPT